MHLGEQKSNNARPFVDHQQAVVNATGLTVQLERNVDAGSMASRAQTGEAYDEEKGKKPRKLVSGKCTKPDEANIKTVVAYPHEMLNTTYVSDRTFEVLSFSQLVAGELELLASFNMTMQEKEARISVLRALAYQKEFVTDRDIRECYDSVMKSIEHGKATWSSELEVKVNWFCDFRANQHVREKVKETVDKVGSTKEIKRDGELKVVYCLEYNKGTCTHKDHHEGKFAGRNVVKWHVCRKCLAETKEKKFHTELDSKCPLKK